MALLRPSLTIAGYTVREALRNRLLWLFALMAVGAVGLSGFVNALALTESRQIQVALLAAALRVGAVFLVATFVVTSMQREANDKGLELLLAMALPRAAYLLGKMGGYAALSLLPALLFGGLCLFFAPPLQCALWGLSLLCELWIVAAFCLLCVLSLNQAMPALAAAGAFYLLARGIGGLQLLGHAQGADHGRAQQWMGAGIDLLAILLPRLDNFTRTEWLVYASGGAGQLADIAAQTAIYVSLLLAAALFDLYRKAI